MRMWQPVFASSHLSFADDARWENILRRHYELDPSVHSHITLVINLSPTRKPLRRVHRNNLCNLDCLLCDFHDRSAACAIHAAGVYSASVSDSAAAS